MFVTDWLELAGENNPTNFMTLATYVNAELPPGVKLVALSTEFGAGGWPEIKVAAELRFDLFCFLTSDWYGMDNETAFKTLESVTVN